MDQEEYFDAKIEYNIMKNGKSSIYLTPNFPIKGSDIFTQQILAIMSFN